MSEEKGFVAEFKKFIKRGNVLDMAVGIVVGGSFTAIVNSVVKDIINPVIGLLIGNIDFAEMRVVLQAATETTGEVAIRYGVLLQNVISFLLTALVLFIIVRGYNRIKEKKAQEAKAKAEAKKAEEAAAGAARAAEEAAKPPVVPEDIALLREIRDLLRK